MILDEISACLIYQLHLNLHPILIIESHLNIGIGTNMKKQLLAGKENA